MCYCNVFLAKIYFVDGFFIEKRLLAFDNGGN